MIKYLPFLIFSFFCSSSFSKNIIMPDKRHLLCCEGTQGVKTDIPTIGKTLYYCVSYNRGKRVKHGNFHSFENGLLSEEKVFFNDRLKPGIKTFSTCVGLFGKASAKGGLKLKGKPLKPRNLGKLTKEVGSNVSLGNTVKSINHSSPDEGSSVIEEKPSSNDEGGTPEIAQHGKMACPISKELEGQMKARLKWANKFMKYYPICSPKNPSAKAFLEKMQLVELKVKEEGLKRDPCFHTFFKINYYEKLILWEHLRLRYCHADKANWKIEYNNKFSVKMALKYAPYDPVGVRPPLKSLSPSLHKKVLLFKLHEKKAPSFVTPKEVITPFNALKNSIENSLLKNPEIQQMKQKVLSAMP